MKRIVLLLAFVCVFIFPAQKAEACSCGRGKVVDANGNPVKMDPDELKKFYLEKFEGALFTGEVSKIRKVKAKTNGAPMSLLRVTMKVEQFWRGVETTEIDIFTSYGAGSCGVTYVEGKKYFVFAQNLEWGLTTDGCTAFESLEKASDFIKMLGEGKSFQMAAKPNKPCS